MSVIEQLKILKERYSMKIPKEYEEFIESTEPFDYSDSILKANDIEIELNHFLKEDEGNPSRDLLSWYSYSEAERVDYLTIAMGYGNEEIAIKVKGNDVGGIYYIDQTEDVIIKKLYNNFNELKKHLAKEIWNEKGY